MRKNDLCNDLRQPFSKGRRCGTVKTGDSTYKNIWFVVPPPPPEKPPHKLPALALAKANKALNQLLEIEEEQSLDRFVAMLFQRREALASSRMEGTWSTIDHVLTPEDCLGDLGKKSATASIRGYAAALEQNFGSAKKQRYKLFSTPFIRRLHKIIVSKDPSFDGTPGSLRSECDARSVVFIGGINKESSIYNPAPPEYVKQSLNETLAWFRNDLIADAGDAGINGMTLPIRLALGHSHFEAVHPFQDGNGRIGRILWPFQMALSGYSPLYLSGFVETEKDEYSKALESSQKRLQYAPIIEFICEAIFESHREAINTKGALLKLPEEWQKRGKFRRKSAAERAFPFLIRSPIMTARELSTTLDISFQAASTALKSLEKCGVIKERTGFGRNRIFAAEEVLALIGRPFGVRPEKALEKVRRLLIQKSE
jgi:Fic family protein